MKGISTIIASIILVVITIGLISVAYLYMSGLLSGTTAKNIQLMDAYCDLTSSSNYNITAIVKNIGTANITTLTSFIDGKSADPVCSVDFGPQETVTCKFNQFGSSNIVAGMHQLRVVSSSSVGGPVNC
jgi:hypothetical protein